MASVRNRNNLPPNNGDPNAPEEPSNRYSPASVLVTAYKRMGKIYKLNDNIVTIRPISDAPKYNVNTILFLEKGYKKLGAIDAVLAPLNTTSYIICMKNSEVLESFGMKIGDYVAAVEVTECAVTPPHLRRRLRPLNRHQPRFLRPYRPPNRRSYFMFRRRVSAVRLPPIYPWQQESQLYYRPVRMVPSDECLVEVVHSEDLEEPDYQTMAEELETSDEDESY